MKFRSFTDELLGCGVAVLPDELIGEFDLCFYGELHSLGKGDGTVPAITTFSGHIYLP